MNPHDLIRTARDLTGAGRGRPRQSNLHRATSTAYYALFHALARTNADLLIGSAGSNRSRPAWRQVYRALEHGTAKAACEATTILAEFPQQIQDFANSFVEMQGKRHNADYDPGERTYKSAVEDDIRSAERAITKFEAAPARDRRAFAAWVLFRKRK